MSDRSEAILAAAREVLRTERDGLAALEAALDAAFARAVETITALKGYLVVSGVGKSGHIGAKIAATMASTGTPAFFLHPSEAAHGDLGMVTAECAVLAISNSGASEELRALLGYARSIGAPVIGVTRSADSLLGRSSDIILTLPKAPEAGPLGLAPTTSTTMTLALGDALAVAAMRARGFTAEDFARRHPAGLLGMRLKTCGQWIAERSAAAPTVAAAASFAEAVHAVGEGRRGCVAVIDDGGGLVGLITDGDIRRAIDAGAQAPQALFARTAAQVMTRSPFTATPGERLGEVFDVLAARRLGAALVVDDGRPVGVVDLKDLVDAGFG